MTTAISDPAEPPWETLQTLLAAEDAQEVQQFLNSLPVTEVARATSRLDSDEQTKLLTLLDPHDAAEIIEEVPDAQAVDLIEDLEPGQAAAILDEMRSDEQADLLADLDAEDAEAILEEMEPDEAADARQLMAYPSDTAGGLMITEYLVYMEDLQVQDVLEDLQQHGSKYADYDVQYAYVTSKTGALVGVLLWRDLMLSFNNAVISTVMRPDPLRVSAVTPLEELHQFFEEHSFLGVPVTNEEHHLVGLVRRTAVEKADNEQANKTYLESSGIVGGEELRSMKLWTRASRRLSWLSINIVLNILAASVIAFYQDTLAAVIALAVFLPIISDMSGCSGNQAVAVSIRELTLGLVRPGEIFRVVIKETGVGLLNGVILGCLIGGVAWIWQDNVFLGLVVGGALAANTLLAVLLGGLIPLILRGFNMDPALASGPLLTTVTDMCGFFLVLSLASILLAKLV